jgi:hypothetical protein
VDLTKARRKKMAFQIYFETLASGMHAKLNSRYRTQNNHVRISKNNNKSLYPKGVTSGFLGDTVSKHRTFT